MYESVSVIFGRIRLRVGRDVVFRYNLNMIRDGTM